MLVFPVLFSCRCVALLNALHGRHVSISLRVIITLLPIYTFARICLHVFNVIHVHVAGGKAVYVCDGVEHFQAHRDCSLSCSSHYKPYGVKGFGLFGVRLPWALTAFTKILNCIIILGP